MSTFRDDLGVALERIARLEDENRTLRAELLLAAEPRLAEPAEPSPIERSRIWNWDVACWGLMLVVCVVGAALASTTTTTTTRLDDIGLGCTTPVIDPNPNGHANGTARPTCLSMPP